MGEQRWTALEVEVTARATQRYDLRLALVDDRPKPPSVTRIDEAPSLRRSGPEYVVRRATGGDWRWWLRSHDAEVLAGSAAPSSTSVGANLKALRIRITAAGGPTELVADRHGSWRWRLLTRAGQAVAVSTIGFASQWAAERALDRFRLEASHADLIDEELRPVRPTWPGEGGAH